MKKNKVLNMSKKVFLTFCATSALVTISYAKPGGGNNGEPPKEAIEVCKGLDEGTKCTMQTPRGTLNGLCMNTPDKKYFVCMPEGGEKREDRR